MLRKLAFLIIVTCLIPAFASISPAGGSEFSLEEWYSNTAKDIKTGKPLVITQFVALCDNENQGIVPVSKALGDGDNGDTNLYWGAGFGYRTHFKRAKAWKAEHIYAVDDPFIEVAIFSRTASPTGAWQKYGVTTPFKIYLVALGYRGKFIDKAMDGYFDALAGRSTLEVALKDGTPLFAGGASHFVSYAGHDYFMDIQGVGEVLQPGRKLRGKPKATMILACMSKQFIGPKVCTNDSMPVVLTRQFMAPEAYTAEAVYNAIAAGKDGKSIMTAAASAYARYQKISVKSAKGVFATCD